MTGARRTAQALDEALALALDAAVVVDEDGRVQRVNAAAEALFGWPAAELVGGPVERLLPERFRAGHPDRVRSFARSGLRVARLGAVQPIHGLRRDGTEFTVEILVSRVVLEEEALFVASVRDTTEQRRAEDVMRVHARLQAAVARLAMLALDEPDPRLHMRHALDVVVGALMLEAGEVLELPDACGAIVVRAVVGLDRRLVGVAVPAGLDELSGQTLVTSPVVFNTSELRVPLGHVAGEGIESGVLTRIRGRTRPLGVLAVYSRAPRTMTSVELDFLQAAAGVIASVIERGLERDALRRSEERVADLLDAIDGVVWEHDDELRFSFVSRQVERLLGYSAAQLVSDPALWPRIIHEEDRPRALDELRACIAAGGAHEVEFRVVAADGRTVWVRNVLNVTTDGGRRVRGITLDASRQREAERALQRAQQQLLQAQKMEAIGRLAGGVAHDFNNLLTAIGCYADLLRRAGPDDEVRAEGVTEISRAVERATALTRHLLAFSRRQVLQARLVDLNQAIRGIAVMLRRLVGERYTLVLDLAADATCVRADPAQIDQVVVNLVVNARDAMPQGGPITIETRALSRADRDEAACAEAHPHSCADACPLLSSGPWVTMTVRDEGVGVSPAVRDHLFEPFYTTKPQGGGTGLGLSTAFGVVTQSGGTITLRSQPGRGSAFTVWLPRASAVSDPLETEPAAAPALPARVEARRRCPRILVVEDEAPVRALVRRLLAREGYLVDEARDGAEAQRVTSDYAEPPDLVITDMVLPVGTGLDVAELVSTRHPGVKVLYMSAYPPDEVSTAALESSAFLSKPFTPGLLLSKVRELLAAGVP